MDIVEVRNIRRRKEECKRLERFARERKVSYKVEPLRCPPLLRIEVINRCNANCVFCAYQYQKRPVRVMSLDIFKKAVDQYTELGGTGINFSPVVGDSLLDKGLEEKVAYVRSFPQYNKLELFTNGILLTRARFESLVAAGLNEFQVALSGFSEAEYWRVYRNKSYSRVLRNLKKIAESSALKKVKFVVHSRTDSLWYNSEEDYLALNRLDAFPIVFEPHVVSWHKKISQEDLPGHMFLVNPPKNQDRPCLVLWGGLTVLADGRLTLCGCSDLEGTGLPAGDIINGRLDDCFRDGSWLKLISNWVNGTLPEFCRDCDAYYPHS